MLGLSLSTFVVRLFYHAAAHKTVRDSSLYCNIGSVSLELSL